MFFLTLVSLIYHLSINFTVKLAKSLCWKNSKGQSSIDSSN